MTMLREHYHRSREELIARGIVNLTSLVTGAVLLSIQYGWKTGIGATALVYFLKAPER